MRSCCSSSSAASAPSPAACSRASCTSPALEWLLRGLDTGEFLGITAPGLFKNGFRMAVISVIIMVVVLFFRKGIMGDKELPDLLRRHTKKGGGEK